MIFLTSLIENDVAWLCSVLGNDIIYSQSLLVARDFDTDLDVMYHQRLDITRCPVGLRPHAYFWPYA